MANRVVTQLTTLWADGGLVSTPWLLVLMANLHPTALRMMVSGTPEEYSGPNGSAGQSTRNLSK